MQFLLLLCTFLRLSLMLVSQETAARSDCMTGRRAAGDATAPLCSELRHTEPIFHHAFPTRDPSGGNQAVPTTAPHGSRMTHPIVQSSELFGKYLLAGTPTQSQLTAIP